MAIITPSADAPNELVSYSFADDAVFSLGGTAKKNASFTTDDPAVIDAARQHPWLTVEAPVEASEPTWREQSVAPQDDPLSAEFTGTRPDADTVEAPAPEPVAIEAGKTQTDATAPAPDAPAETLAAAADTTAKDKN